MNGSVGPGDCCVACGNPASSAIGVALCRPPGEGCAGRGAIMNSVSIVGRDRRSYREGRKRGAKCAYRNRIRFPGAFADRREDRCIAGFLRRSFKSYLWGCRFARVFFQLGAIGRDSIVMTRRRICLLAEPRKGSCNTEHQMFGRWGYWHRTLRSKRGAWA